MKRIDKIRIKNFKAFPELQEFDLKCKNLLVYGDNGSGKSSLYWALYTFLQSSEKTIDHVNKYFVRYVENDIDTFQSLRNIFSNEDESFIEIEMKSESPIRISQDNISDVLTASVKEANKASDFINYKLLQNFYNSTHKQELNLWNVFERDIFPFLQFPADGITYYEKLSNLCLCLPKDNNGQYYRRDSSFYAQYQQKIAHFNKNLSILLGNITVQANNFLRKKFDIVNIEIILEYTRELKWDADDCRSFTKPEIKLSIKNENICIHRPQSFLNEAVLSQIAISVRFGALLTRLASSDWKILVLDDMLISLDMSNRMKVSEIILEDDDLGDFQKIIMTHDKGFFDILKSRTNSLEWEYLNIYKDDTIRSKPIVKSDKTELEKAKEFFESNEFDACANYLRKETEKILKHYLKKELKNEFETLTSLIGRAKNAIESERLARFKKLFKYDNSLLEKLKIDLECDTDLSEAEKGRLRSIRHNIVNFMIQETTQQTKLTCLLDELSSIKDRILNPGSHGNSVPLYSQELQAAIHVVEQLHNLLS